MKNPIKWISVKERLPELWQPILVYCPQYLTTKDFVVASYFVGEFEAEVTHWMPTPEAPPASDQVEP